MNAAVCPPITTFFERPSHLLGSNAPSSWPYRLLHIPTWTSYIRQAGNIYNGVKQPRYNILSYTWGRFQVPNGPSVSIAGLDWPVPAVNPAHFTVEEFTETIKMAATGSDFVWVDIACIPQQHEGEIEDAVRIRGEEIGRQARIFARGSDAFAWFCKLEVEHLIKDRRPAPFMLLKSYLRAPVPASAGVAVQYLDQFDGMLTSLEGCLTTLLTHPWMSSLWTLQECILRPTAWILLGKGELLFQPGQEHMWTMTTLRDLCSFFCDLTLHESSVQRI